MKKMKMTPTTIYRTYRRNSFFRRRRFLRFWKIKLTFIAFACKNQYFVVDWSRRVFTGEKVNWPAAYSWITLDSRYMAKISAADYLWMRPISENTVKLFLKVITVKNFNFIIWKFLQMSKLLCNVLKISWESNAPSPGWSPAWSHLCFALSFCIVFLKSILITLKEQCFS